jgi:hypothetical protein
MSNQSYGNERDQDQKRQPGNPDRRANHHAADAQGQDKGKDQQRNPNPSK